MRSVLLGLSLLWSFAAFGIPCDCDVTIYAPLTGSHNLPPRIIRTLELEEYSNYSVKNQRQCRQSCEKEFHQEMTAERLNALLLTYSQQLIDQRTLGFNCTGLTTLKYPVRVRARLENFGLGNVVDLVQTVNHEEICF